MVLGRFARLVVLAHSVFALPFALWGFVLGLEDKGVGEWLWKLVWTVMAAVSARTAGMAFNRYVDWPLDARNPRTAMREIPRGEVRPWEALTLSLISAGIFILAAWMLSPLCGMLAPVALFILLGYSYTKRFTYLSHYVLGSALGLAPVGAYVAAAESFTWYIWVIGAAVALWVGGFDILYALQDEEFDRQAGLWSLPAAFGEKRSRRIALLSHLLAIALLGFVGHQLYSQHATDTFYWIGYTAFGVFVLYQHKISRDKARINRAFFTYNGMASVVFGGMAILSLLLES